ncbi:8435_t:CDS:2 [Acaulospora morrowiae]|uniref:8435_t:CDS:1 n=1 Tax=Acaulospora morrowiae TaxID=94023 RepID=A0A9N8YWI2_9GLOM|nr:8435_t:CDS:2 [Acaulospora morrowiae]
MTNSKDDGTEKSSVQVGQYYQYERRAVRIRPMTNGDAAALPTRFQRQVITVVPPNSVVVQSEKKLAFSYDHVFGPESSQQDIYEKAIVKLVDKFLEGYNVTVLAYGQTSSGKTHTMGTADNSSIPFESKGIIPRAMTTLFNQTNEPKYRSNKFSIKVSFIEIYNEDLIDLLGDGDTRSQVTIREDLKGNILWSGLQEIKVNGVDELMSHLSRGSQNRQVGATQMNAQSSRSHAIFSVTMTQQKYVASSNSSSPSPPPSKMTELAKSGIRPVSSTGRLNKQFDEGSGESVTVTSKFHFVDLAGSERLKRTSAVGDRAKEGISINSGLLALGNVISALGDPNKAKHTTHIPYRDSKLTRLLQDSLGGNAQTLMIACVSPAEFNLNETVNTLKYANRARNIKNNAVVNQEEAGWQDLEYVQSLVVKLRNEVKLLKSGGALALATSNGSTSGRSSACGSSSSGRNTPTQLTTNNSLDHSSLLLAPNNANGVASHSLLKKPSIHLSASINGTSTQEPIVNDDDDDNFSQKFVQMSISNSNGIHRSAKVDDGDEASSSPPPVVNDKSRFMLQKQSFQEVVEPVIEEYEKSISALESQLALSRAALAHADSLMSDRESRLEYAEQLNSDNLRLIDELKMKISELSNKDVIFVQHIKELESKIEMYEEEQKKDQEIIKELRECVKKLKEEEDRLRANEEHYRKQGEINGDRIKALESQLVESDQKILEFSKRVEKLEIRLKERGDLFLELEKKLVYGDGSDGEKDKKFLLNEILERENRISLLEERVNELVLGLDDLKRSKLHEDEASGPLELLKTEENRGNTEGAEDLQTKLSELQQTHEKTVTEFSQIKSKYQECLGELQDIKMQLSQSKLNEARLVMNNNYNDSAEDLPSTPITPISPSSTLMLNSPTRFSPFAATIAPVRASLPATMRFDELSKDEYSDEYNSLKQEIHRKTQSLSGELRRRERDSAAVIDEGIINSTQKSVDTLEMKLAALQQELAIRSEFSSNSSTSDSSSDGNSDSMDGVQNDNSSDKESLMQDLKTQLEFLKDLKLKYERYDQLKRDFVEQEDLQKRIEDKEAEAEEYRKQLVEIKSQRDEMQVQIYDLQAQLTNKSSAEGEVQTQELENTKAELEKIRFNEQSALEKIRTLDEREAGLIREIENLRTIESEYKEKISLLESKISAQSDAGMYDNEQLQDLIRIRRELILAKESSDVYKQTINDLEIKLEKSNLEYLTLRNKVDLLKSRMKSQRSEIEFREIKDIETRQQMLISKELESLRSLDTYIQQQHESKISDLENEVRSLQQQKSDADINFNTVTYKLNAEIKELEFKILESQKESENLRSEIKLLQNMELEQKTIIKQLRSELNDSTNANHILEIELSGLKKSAEEQKNYVELLKEELKSVRSNESTEGLTNLLSNAMKERDEDKQKIQDLSLELLLMKEKMRNIESTKLTEGNLEVNELKKKCAQLEGLAEEAKNELLELGTRNSEMTERLSVQLEKAQSEAKLNHDRVESLEEINRQLKAEKELQLTTNEDLTTQIKNVQADLENLVLVYAETAKKCELADLNADEQKLRISELERELDEVNKRNMTISASMATTNSKLEGLTSANENLQQVNSDLNEKVKEAEEESALLSQEIKALRSELEKLEITNNSSIEELKGKISVLETEKGDLVEEKKKLEKRLLEEPSRRRRPSFGMASVAENEPSDRLRLSVSSQLSVSTDSKRARPNMTIAAANLVKTPPPNPPPNQPLPPTPGSATPTSGLPVLNSSKIPRSRPNSFVESPSTPSDISSEVQKLNRKIAKIESDNMTKSILIDSLEDELTKSEKTIESSNTLIETLKNKNSELTDQITYLRSRLDETTVEFEHEKSNVYEEKKVIENVLEEERRAKLELENSMKELMAKKKSFLHPLMKPFIHRTKSTTRPENSL